MKTILLRALLSFLLGSSATIASANSDLPAYLQAGSGHYCLDTFGTPSRQACDTLVSKALEQNGQGNCMDGPTEGKVDFVTGRVIPVEEQLLSPPDIMSCLGNAFGIFSGSNAAQDEIISALLNFRALEAQKFERNQRRAASARGSGGTTRTFVINQQSFELPTSFNLTGERGAEGGGRRFQIWSNFHPAEACPQQPFILFDYLPTNPSDGYPAFYHWSNRSDWRSSILQAGQVLKTTGPNSVPACKKTLSYEIVFYALDQGEFFGGLVVPNSEIGRMGDGLSYIRNFFKSTIDEYAKPQSRQY